MPEITARLYWSDPELLAFAAEVLGAERRGAAFAVVLDRTAFHPAGGGQPSDRGTIGAGRVVDVVEEDGGIVHVVAGLAEAPRGAVRCEVDAQRRDDIACQHTAQHVVSAVAASLFGARTVGFHLGERATTVDLEGGDLTAERVRELERAANAIVREDRAVRTSFATGAERRKGDRLVREEGELRVVTIEGLGDNACSGAHVGRTGRMGAIRLGRIERVRAALRVELFAGARILDEAARAAGILSALSERSGAGADELVPWAEATLAELKELRRRNAELLARATAAEAAALNAGARIVGEVRIAAAAVEGRDGKALRALAAEIRQAPRTVAIVGASSDGKAALVVARSGDLPIDVRPIAKAAAEALAAKGGGAPDLAQCGGGDPLRLDAAIAAALALVERAIGGGGPA